MKKIVVLVIVMMLSIIVGCSDVDADKEVASARVVTLHEQLNSQNTEDIKSSVDPMMLEKSKRQTLPTTPPMALRIRGCFTRHPALTW